MNATTALLIEPRSPLVFRSGRPFGADGAGGGADSHAFPPPATVAGAIRAAYADALDWRFDATESAAALVGRFEVHGPLLALMQADGTCEALFPKPADAVYLERGNSVVAVAAYPANLTDPASAPRAGCDLPDFGLMPPILSIDDASKPSNGPAYWTLNAITEWLIDSTRMPPADSVGISGPRPDRRTHVTIDPGTLTAEEGRLFQTVGIEFGARSVSGGWAPWRLALLARTRDASTPGLGSAVAGRVRRFGADGRSARFLETRGWPEVPGSLNAELDKAQCGDLVRLMLVTPALFANGWHPGWLKQIDTKVNGSVVKRLEGTPPGAPTTLKLRLVGAVVNRWQAFSGWDMDKKKARAVRRAAPAGSVYWFELVDGAGADLAGLWLEPISDRFEDRHDGFGLTLPGLGRPPASPQRNLGTP